MKSGSSCRARRKSGCQVLASALVGDPRGGGLDGFGVQEEVSLALKTCSGALRRSSPEGAPGLGSMVQSSVPTMPSFVPTGPMTEARNEVAMPPQPVETCSFCFPERSSPTQESAPRSLGIHGFAGTAAPQPCMRASVSGLAVVRTPTGDERPGA